MAAALEARGADAPVLIVGGDDRVRRYRHPMAVGAPVRHLAMAVVVAPARRAACRGHPLRQCRTAAARSCSRAAGPGAPDRGRDPGRVPARRTATGTCSAPWTTATPPKGAPGGWAGHYQGGPIGYAQREFEIAPGQGGSRWPGVRIEPGHAVAWNPSLPGGAKAEDTYLVHADGLERVTTGPGWPAGEAAAGIPPRPLVLEVQ